MLIISSHACARNRSGTKTAHPMPIAANVPAIDRTVSLVFPFFRIFFILSLSAIKKRDKSMSLTLDSSLFYTLLLLITEVRHHLCSNAPDTLPLVEISFPQLHPHYFYFRLQTPNPAKSPCLPSLYCHPSAQM